jgi:hypothetical protein
MASAIVPRPSPPDVPDVDPTGIITPAMVRQIVGGAGATNKSAGRMYWRGPDGYIHTEARDPATRLRWLEAGAVPLLAYGSFPYCVYTLEHPYEVLFMRGGAKELKLEHIKEMGYHLHPPLVPTCGIPVEGALPDGRIHYRHTEACWAEARPVQFPQLDLDYRGTRFICEFCGLADFASQKALDQHSRVMHKDEANEWRLANAIARAAQGGGPRDSD